MSDLLAKVSHTLYDYQFHSLGSIITLSEQLLGAFIIYTGNKALDTADLLLLLMQRKVAREKFNVQPVVCACCSSSFPNYRMLITKRDKILCYACSIKSIQQIEDIKDSYKEYYERLFNMIPLPDYKIAKDCLETVNTLKKKTNELLQQIRKKLSIFENDLTDYFQQTVYICQGYIDKVKNIEDSTVNSWHKHPPKLVDQEKFIFNIKQKQFLAGKIEESLKELKFSLPNIEQIKKEALKYRSRLICNRVCITSAISIRGILYLGTNDGRIIYSDSFQNNQIKAHQSLIRDFQHDGQFKLFSSSDDQVIKMWDLRESQPKLLRQFGNIPKIRSSHRELALIDKGRCLASTRGQFDEYKIRIWDLQTFENSKTLVGHRGYIKGIVTTKQNQLITVSEDRYLKIWNLKLCEQEAEYFHSCKLTHVFYNNQKQLICIIDQQSKVILLDLATLAVFNGVWTGRKVQMAAADSFIYIHNDRHLNIYTWDLSLVEKVDLGLSYAATNIIEMFTRLLITDANGTLHEFSPQCLNSSAL